MSTRIPCLNLGPRVLIHKASFGTHPGIGLEPIRELSWHVFFGVWFVRQLQEEPHVVGRGYRVPRPRRAKAKLAVRLK